jgi:hypothetical protein
MILVLRDATVICPVPGDVTEARLNFVRQQGFAEATGATCGIQYPALAFQPRAIGVLLLVGVILQSPTLFLVLSAVLVWNASVPALNPFDWLYASFVALRTGRWSVMTARGPRRFAQGLAAAFMLVIGVSLFKGWRGLAWMMETVLVFAVVALVFGRFCLGSYLFHLITGNRAYAHRTLPWSR